MTTFVLREAKPEGERGLDSFEWRKRMGVELEASSRRERSGSPQAKIPSEVEGTRMAEASGGRTHQQRANPPLAGFEDRDDHRTACASVYLR